MKNFILLFLLSSFLLAQNPKPYAPLSDVIYNNSNAIEQLKYMNKFEPLREKIEHYIVEVERAKKEGFRIESSHDMGAQKVYLGQLRELIKTHEYFIRVANSSFEESLSSEDSPLFESLIHSGLINVQENKLKIRNYYLQHSEEINTTGVIQTILDEEEAKEKKIISKVPRSAKKQEESKIQRIRKNDKLKQEALQKSLEEEATRKKIQIRENQIRELAN